jgi:hypothetical protein
MTGFGVGHPDWQAYAQWRDVFFYNNNIDVAGNDTFDVGDFITTNWASLLVKFSCADLGCTLSLEWFADTELTENLDNDVYDITSNSLVIFMTPARGQAVIVTVVNSNGSDVICQLAIQPTNIPIPRVCFPITPFMTSVLSQSVAHSSVDNRFPFNIVGGPACVTFIPHDTTGKLNFAIVAQDDTGTNIAKLVQLIGPTVTTTVNFIAPVQPLLISTTNTDTVTAHLYDMALVMGSQ